MDIEDLSKNGSNPFTPVNPSINKCNYFVNSANQTVVFHFTNPYGGIPQNLAFNAIGFVILMVLFAILRKAAGNYGRLALIRKDDQEANWTQIFFGGEKFEVSTIQTIDAADPTDVASRSEENTDSMDFHFEEHDKTIFGWIRSIFTLTDEQFHARSGEDAVQYLRFQRHLIIFVSIITIVCIGVILPVNYQGDLQGTAAEFGHTTISNLQGDDNLLWVHVVIAILFFPLGIIFMRHFSVGLKITVQEHGEGSNDKSVASRTLMILSIPRYYCTKEALTQHFSEAYPEDEIEEISVAYDVRKLTKLDTKREEAKNARINCENFQSRHGSGQQIIPHRCGIICSFFSQKCPGFCCTCSPIVDALTFYRKEEEYYAQRQNKERTQAYMKPTGIAFVSFKKLESSMKVYREHEWRCWAFFSYPPESSLSRLLEPHKWVVRYAPPPEDIYWENITGSHSVYVTKAFVINIVAFIILFFFTSPSVILSQLELVLNLRNITDALELPSKLNDFVPTLLLWSVSALLPNIIAYSDWILGHWRRSVENLWIMRKVFIFLLFMVLILPSVGLTSLRGFLEAMISSAELSNGTSNYTFEWNCIFLPDNGAFFVNYVITSAIVGSALELLRVSELLVYAFRMCLARSTAETSSVRKAVFYEYSFGFNYSWLLLIFALTVTYSVVCPLITPFGLFYLVMKHLVDRYNLYFTYKRSKINKNIHAAAVNFVVFCLLLQQIVLLSFNIVRMPLSESDTIFTPRVIVSLTFISLYFLILIGAFFWQTFKGISPIQYYTSPGARFTTERDSETSGVLQDLEIFTEERSPARLKKERYVPAVLRKDIGFPLPQSPVRLDPENVEEPLSPSH